MNIQGKNTIQFQNPNELAYAMTVRTMDWSRDYSYWFSKEVGLQQRGSYELKKDFFKVELGKQVYVIPKGREINKVMYVTPSTTKAALYGNLGTLDTGIDGAKTKFPAFRPFLAMGDRVEDVTDFGGREIGVHP